MVILLIFSALLLFSLSCRYYITVAQYDISEFCLAQRCFNIYSSASEPVKISRPPRNILNTQFPARAREDASLREELTLLCAEDAECIADIQTASFYEMNFLLAVSEWCDQDNICQTELSDNSTASVKPNQFLYWRIHQESWQEQQHMIQQWVIHILAKIQYQRGHTQATRPIKILSRHKFNQNPATFELPLLIDSAYLYAGNSGMPVFCGTAITYGQRTETLIQQILNFWSATNTDFIFIAETDQLLLNKYNHLLPWLFSGDALFRKSENIYCG